MKGKKDSFYAKVSFYLSLGFWVPLFNLALSMISIFYAMKALKLIKKKPNKYGGFTYAIIALVLSVSSLLMSVFGIIVYFKKKSCVCPVCPI